MDTSPTGEDTYYEPSECQQAFNYELQEVSSQNYLIDTNHHFDTRESSGGSSIEQTNDYYFDSNNQQSTAHYGSNQMVTSSCTYTTHNSNTNNQQPTQQQQQQHHHHQHQHHQQHHQQQQQLTPLDGFSYEHYFQANGYYNNHQQSHQQPQQQQIVDQDQRQQHAAECPSSNNNQEMFLSQSYQIHQHHLNNQEHPTHINNDINCQTSNSNQEMFLSPSYQIHQQHPVNQIQKQLSADCLNNNNNSNNNNNNDNNLDTLLSPGYYNQNYNDIESNTRSFNNGPSQRLELNSNQQIDQQYELISCESIRPALLEKSPYFTVNKQSLKRRRGRPRKKSMRSAEKVNGKLWEFIRDLLLNETTNPSYIRWERREDGVFKFVQSDQVAKMWGERKQNSKMTYEKLSRAMRYYYKSKILLPVFGRRLVYKFGPNATGWSPTTTT